jgi:DNA polymerase IV
MYRKIIHFDLDAFFCAVEELHNPKLIGKPFAVGGRPDQRGVVASCSYAARKFGVRSAIPMARAVRLCPNLKIIPPHHKIYLAESKQVMERLFNVTDLVEQVSIDEAYLDVTNLTEPADLLARNIQSTIRSELSLPCSLGVASNKLVAKIATDFGKAKAQTQEPPNAIQIVPPGQEADFLKHLPVKALWGVGPKTSARLSELGIYTIGDLAQMSAEDLIHHFGKHGQQLALHAKGIDDQPVVTSRLIKSISRETTFSHDIQKKETLQATLKSLSKRISNRLKKEQLVGSTIKLKLRLANFTTLTRQITLEHPTDDEEIIFRSVDKLFLSKWQHGQAVRLLGVGISNLRMPIQQLELWEPGLNHNQVPEKEIRLYATVKKLRSRFGNQILHWRKTDEVD